MDQPPYTSADLAKDVHKLLVDTATTALSDHKLAWTQVAPFADAARALCRDDFRLNGQVAVHGVEGVELTPADEAFLSISIRDRDDGVEWLSHTYWLSDLALADRDPERVRSAVAAIERTVAKLREWLAARESDAGEAGSAPPAPSR